MHSPSRQVPYWQLLAAVALTAAVSITAFSVAQTGGASAARVKACYAKKGSDKGVLRKAKRCRKGERKLTWNTRGPAGPRGAVGASGVDASAVSGQVAFFDLGACPTGWSAYAPGAGRYVVGMPAGGSLGATAGTPLTNVEDRPVGQHTHAVVDPGHTHAVPYDNEMYSVPDQNTLAGTQQVGVNNLTATTAAATTGISIANAGSVPGTNAPYVQLLACRKN